MPPEVNSSPIAAVQLCKHERVRLGGGAILARLQVTDGERTRTLILRGSVPRMRLLAEAIFAAGESAPREQNGTGANLLAQLEADAARVPAKGDPERQRPASAAAVAPRPHPALDRSSPAWEAICALPVIGPIKYGRRGISDDQEAVLRQAWAAWEAHGRAVPKARIAVRLGVSEPTILRHFRRFAEGAGNPVRAPLRKPNGRML